MTSLLPTALVNLTTTQFTFEYHDGETVLAYHVVMGRRDGSNKTDRGELKAVSANPLHLLIWPTEAMDCNLCIIDDIKEYLSIRSSLIIVTDWVFKPCSESKETLLLFIKKPYG